MRSAAVTASLVFAGIALLVSGATVLHQREQIDELRNDLAKRRIDDQLTAQANCAELAHRNLVAHGFKQEDGPNGDTVNYENHFNSKLRKCFVLVRSYSPNDDFLTIDLYDAVEAKHYATFNGHSSCDPEVLAISGQNPKKCDLDSGQIWFDGNDAKNPADFTVGFRGLRYGGGSGDATTQKTFLDHVQPFMSE